MAGKLPYFLLVTADRLGEFATLHPKDGKLEHDIA